MKIKKLYTAGDGFCYNHHWPMWSELLAQILDCEWVNLSTYGAGNEAIANLVLDEIDVNEDYTDSLWLIQWTGSSRLDLRVDHLGNNDPLLQQIYTDSDYYDNFIFTAKQKKYWCSGASSITFVDEYRKLISQVQHNDRSVHHQLSVAYALSQIKCNWKYLLTYAADWLPTKLINPAQWISTDLSSFRQQSKFAHLDVNEIQPVSSIHLDFLEQFVLPHYEYDLDRFLLIKNKTLLLDQLRIENQEL